MVDNPPVIIFVVVYNLAVSDMDNAFRVFGDILLMGDKDDGVPLLGVEPLESVQNYFSGKAEAARACAANFGVLLFYAINIC